MEVFDTEDDRRFRIEVRDFFASNLPDELRRAVRHLGNLIDRPTLMKWHDVLLRKGWAGTSWPVEYGGNGWSLKQQYIYEQELAAAWGPWAIPFAFDMVGHLLIKFGTAEQRQRYLPKMLTGEQWWCQGFSEPGAGSDLAALTCKAERRGDHYVINGSKIWQTLVLEADMMFGLFRTDSSGRKQQGISVFVLDIKSPGLTVQPIKLFDGIETVGQCFFDNVMVPVDQLIGAENDGWTIAKYLLTLERLGIAEVARSKAALRYAEDVTRATGEKSELIRSRLVMLDVELRALEATEYRMLFDPAANGELGSEASILKLRGSALRQEIADLTVELLGPHSDFAENGRDAASPTDEGLPAARQFFNLLKVSIYGGSNEIQRNIVAKAVLGL